MPRCWKRSAPNWTATIARGWKRSARRSDRVFRHAGLVPASNPPRAIALEARWTPEPVRGDGMSSRSEEHTSELQSLMRISYAVFCLKKKNKSHNHQTNTMQHTYKHQAPI